MKGVHLAIRFVLELCLLGALGVWGVHAARGHSILVQFGLAIAVPAVAAMVWGMALSPRARAGLSPITRLVLSLPMFGLGAAALTVAVGARWGIPFGIIAGLNTGILIVLEIAEPTT